eukprot:GHUV01042741.1.p1 GENE.GHUV01042741.1~~GHUV01042741.1.p1  ORF type:complete len:119 (-),score=24.61 GHUV01042741.1:128-484(-)
MSVMLCFAMSLLCCVFCSLWNIFNMFAQGVLGSAVVNTATQSKQYFETTGSLFNNPSAVGGSAAVCVGTYCVCYLLQCKQSVMPWCLMWPRCLMHDTPCMCARLPRTAALLVLLHACY